MFRGEEFTGHLGPHPRPGCGRQRRIGRKAGCRLDSSDVFGHLEPERADDTLDDPERSSETGRILIVARGEVRSFQLLLSHFGKRVEAAAEQRSHLLCSHRVADA